MKNKKRHSLGNPATIIATGELLRNNPQLVQQASNGVSKFFKGVLLLGGCVVGGLVIRKQYKLWKSRQDAKNEAGSIKNATLSDSEAKILAEKLYSAMKGLGTNLTKIKEVWQQCMNEDDVNLIILKFSSRDGMTLSQWINDDISSASDREKYINSILRAKGISKQF
ncbi:MAG: hypothetical protein MJ197_03535 [Bacteroidales bacterium]|nr:hypothetical protein [Bacteroidales bacterium]